MKPALLLVDIQKGLDEMEYYGDNRNNLDAESNARKLLDYWRANNLPLFHVKHNSTNPNSPLFKGKLGNEIKDIVKPLEDEIVIEKNVNSAFIGTDLQQRLDAQSIQKVIIVGLTTEHCISTTTRMAANLGYETYLIADATAAFDKQNPNGSTFPAQLVHDIAIANLNEEFATVMSTEELLSTVLSEF